MTKSLWKNVAGPEDQTRYLLNTSQMQHPIDLARQVSYEYILGIYYDKYGNDPKLSDRQV